MNTTQAPINKRLLVGALMTCAWVFVVTTLMGSAVTAMADPVPVQRVADPITEYQARLEADCVRAGRVDARRPMTAVRAYCSCVFDALRSEMTPGEWRRAYQMSSVSGDAEWAVVKAKSDMFTTSCAKRHLQ